MKNIITIVIVFAVGLGLGWYLWGRPAATTNVIHDMHMSTDMMSGAMDNMTAGLAGKTGNTFDKAFLDGMVVHHEGAVAMARMVLLTSKRPELIQLANDIITAQNKEISQMQAWRAAWFK